MQLKLGSVYEPKEPGSVLFSEVEIVAYRPDYSPDYPFMGHDECWYNESGQIAGGSADSPYNLVSEVVKQVNFEKLLYRPVNVKTRKPVGSGWFNMITDASPTACGRVWYDGKEFKLENKCHSWSTLLANGNTIFWLELMESGKI